MFHVSLIQDKPMKCLFGLTSD